MGRSKQLLAKAQESNRREPEAPRAPKERSGQETRTVPQPRPQRYPPPHY